MTSALISKSLSDTEPHASPNLLSPAELEVLSARFSVNADQWLTDNTPVFKVKENREPKSEQGRKPKIINNPFYGFLGALTYWGRYPAFAMDVIEGIARLDWHDQPIETGGRSIPLSVGRLALILETVRIVTNETVENLLQLRERHARRYVKAIELIIPRMMACRPQSLINEMEDVRQEPKPCEWEDCDEMHAPSYQEQFDLENDLRTLTQFRTAEEYEAEWSVDCRHSPAVIQLPTRKLHSKKPDVLEMLIKNVAVKAIERSTGVSAKTIRKWREAMQEMVTDLQVA